MLPATSAIPRTFLLALEVGGVIEGDFLEAAIDVEKEHLDDLYEVGP